MTQLVDTEEAAGPPPSDGLSLVGETKSFLKDWQRILLGSAEWVPEHVAALRERSRALEARARAADVPGLAHHLQSCEHCFWNGEIDKAKLAHCLRNVSEVAWQWRQDLRIRSELYAIEGQGHVSRDRLTIDPPTLLTPPSVELFESTPPPAPEMSPEPEPLPLDSWAKPSLFGRWRGSKGTPRAELDAAPRPRRKKPLAFPSLADAVYADADAPEPSSREALPVRRHGMGGFPWFSASLGVAGVVGVGLLVATLGGSQHAVSAASPGAAAAGAASPGGNGPEAVSPGRGEPASASSTVTSRAALAALRDPPPPVTLGTGAIEQLLSAAHGFGGIESPELADLLDEQAGELGRAGGVCPSEVLGCRLLAAPAMSRSSRTGSAAGSRPAWLEGLEPSGLGAGEDPRVREVFEFHTRNSVGREAFQELLFRCGVYHDLVHGALERYGLPAELAALPMVASGCRPEVEGSEGARGLWQLTPAAAKAYHLRVKAQIVDERIDPSKGTDAAVRLLEDLRRKAGSWELALAAYQLGPFALLSRLQEVGEDAEFWQLDRAGSLPPESAKYVAKAQAFALILANLAKFRFEPAPAHAPDSTAVLEVPPGTRLGLVARAAASSTSKIRELNPDLIGDRVPDWPGEKFVLRVPKEAEPRARETLSELIAAADHADECVPHAFDWGRQRFTSAMASRCEHTNGR